MYIALGVFSGLVILTAIITYISYRIAFHSNRKKHFDLFHDLEGELDDGRRKCRELIENFIKIPFEDVYTESRDGLTLHARYYHVSDGAPVQIQFHGYKSRAQRDMSGIGAVTLAMGHNLLLVDQRAHGESEGFVISFGINERQDVLSWCEYAAARFGNKTKIILCGISMGASSVLMASELELPSSVIGILADCPYSSPRAIIRKVTRDMHLPPFLMFPFVKLAARIFGGFDIDGASCIEAVKNTDIPILLIHGTGDNFVPCSMSDEIAEAGKTVTYHTIEGAAHGVSFIKDNATYMTVLNEFINNIYKEGKTNENQ